MRDCVAERVPIIDLDCIRFNQAERATLQRLANSDNVADKRLCVDYLYCGTGVSANLRFMLELAEVLVVNRSPNVRWGTLNCISFGFAETHPRRLWPFIARWGCHRSRDIRAAVACCMLEDVFNVDFEETFERSKALVEAGNIRFLFTLRTCWLTNKRHEAKIRRYVDRHPRSR
ncbi:MAG: hypothetical protein DWQ45_05465 [Planctomycetota bacterium]|nr:MAG: hypothetical protein DWQ29_14760 [Planctomycetota bacterium]REK20728.1 MAG: hypothetical protein DWQ41_24085 [Planctomycetota bacterium]REK38089.1 MAG: hypothetical protein DWQ45_05465 [Planctomycetota bacterium]